MIKKDETDKTKKREANKKAARLLAKKKRNGKIIIWSAVNMLVRFNVG
jgi:hypothetical protein